MEQNNTNRLTLNCYSYLCLYLLCLLMSSQSQSREVKKPPKIQITNIIAKSHLVPPFSLSSLESKYPFDHKAVLSRIFIPYDHIKFSVFRTGTVMSRAARSFHELQDSFSWLSSKFLAEFNLELSNEYDVLNIVAFSDFHFAFDLHELAPHLLNSSYDPSPLFSEKDEHEHLVNCITYYFHEGRPRYTALIFPTGKVTFTGFKSVTELEAHVLKLSSLLSKISLEHPEVLSK